MTNKWKISLVLLLLIGVISVACVGCGDSASSTSDSEDDEKITLTVTVSAAELGDTEIFRRYMEEHPNIIIEESPTSNSDTKLLSMIASGNPPDVIRFGGYDELPAFVQRGILMPLDELLETSEDFNLDDMYEIMDICKFDGENRGSGSIYGIPKDWSPVGLWINKEAFAEAGIPIPSDTEPMTWDEFADIAKKLVKKDGESIERHGVITALPVPTYLEMYLSSYGKSMWKDDYNSTTLESKETKEAVQFFMDLHKAGAISSNLYPSSDSIGYSALREGKAGMVLGGYWFRGVYQSTGILSSVEDKLMYIPAPIGTVEGCYALDVTCLGIFSGTEHPEEAYELVEYLTLNAESVTIRSKIGYNLPLSTKYTDTLPYETDFDKQVLDMIKNYQLNTFVTKANVCPWISYTSLTTLFDKFYNPVLYDKSTLDKAMTTINGEIEVLVEEGKELVGAD